MAWPKPDDVLDTGAEGCGDLVMLLLRRFRQLQPGQVIEVISSDPGAAADIPAWCRLRGHEFLGQKAGPRPGAIRFFIRRGPDGPARPAGSSGGGRGEEGER